MGVGELILFPASHKDEKLIGLGPDSEVVRKELALRRSILSERLAGLVMFSSRREEEGRICL